MEKEYILGAKKLFDAILKLETEEECKEFFEDLCTIKEIEEMSQRFEVACLLNKKMSYNEISAMTGASTATISRVNRCLQYGGGYKKFFSDKKGE